MTALRVTLLFTDADTGEETRVGTWMIAGPQIDPGAEDVKAMVAEMIHDDLIASEEIADLHCQHW